MKKRRKIQLFGLLLCLALVLVSTVEMCIPASNIYADSIVYITESGSKYHTSEQCRVLHNAKSKIPVERSAAIARGYTACAICAGGTPGGDSSSGTAESNSVSEKKPETIPYADTINIDSARIKMFRLYNPNSGEHFYTANAVEGNTILAQGWKYEGIAWIAPVSSGRPVYRLYNPNAGDHHYTTDANEKNHLVSMGWNYEGIGWYSDELQTTTLYRLYNPNATGAGAHHYTMNVVERDNLTSLGWNYEGTAWYGL